MVTGSSWKSNRPVPEYTSRSRIRDVLRLRGAGIDLLWEHGYDVGDGFVDVLTQNQSLEEAARAGRLRDLPGLLARLNGRSSSGRRADDAGGGGAAA